MASTRRAPARAAVGALWGLGLAGGGGCLGDGTPEGCDKSVGASAMAQDPLQQAFIDAADGDVICLEAGEYSGFEEEITLSADNVVVQGSGIDETILDFTGQQGANGIKITGDGVTFVDLQVRNTPGDGIRADQVEDITFRRVGVLWDDPDEFGHGAYGLYPVGSTGVVIESCVVEGARDAGIYVGQSHHILVIDNEAAQNVAGIEIENSFNAEVRGNRAHDNVGGLLIFNLPGLEQAGGARTKAWENRLERNNHASFAEAGTSVAAVPPGTGLVLLAAQDTEVHDNELVGNDGAAVIVLHCFPPLFGDGCETDTAYDPFPRHNWLHDNTFADNGSDPPGYLADALADTMGNLELPVPELFWDGGYPGCPDAGVDSIPPDELNCFSGNRRSDGSAVEFVNFNLCDNFNESYDIGPMECEHEGLPSMEG